MDGYREHMLVSLNKDTDLPSGEKINCGSSTLSCLSVRGVRTGSCELGDATVILPQSVFKSVMIQHADDQWQVLPCNYKNSADRVKLFMCHGIGDGPVGIRTSQDWNSTHWGTQIPEMPGVWLVPCALPTCHVELKIVRGWDDNMTWEPFPFDNKHIDLRDDSQVIEAHWAAKNISTIVDIPLYKQTVAIAVTLDQDSEIYRLLKSTPGYNLMMKGIKDADNNLLFPKGHQIPMIWSEYCAAHCMMISVQGRLDILRFSLAVCDDMNVVTHIDKHCLTLTSPKYREINIRTNDTVHCEEFVDVRPLKWHTQMASGSLPLGSPAKSLYDLIHHTPAPVSRAVSPGDFYSTMGASNMSLYRDMVLGNGPIDDGQSPALIKTRSIARSTSSVAKSPSGITKSPSRSFSFKHLREKISPRSASRAHVSDDEYSPKKHDDDNAANITGGALASYLRFAQSSTCNSAL